MPMAGKLEVTATFGYNHVAIQNRVVATLVDAPAHRRAKLRRNAQHATLRLAAIKPHLDTNQTMHAVSVAARFWMNATLAMAAEIVAEVACCATASVVGIKATVLR